MHVNVYGVFYSQFSRHTYFGLYYHPEDGINNGRNTLAKKTVNKIPHKY